MEASTPKQFRIIDADSDKPVAIIEATSERQAIERFFLIQSQLSLPKAGKEKLWQCTEHLPDQPRTVPAFSEHFFVILDSMGAVKH